MAPVPKKSRPTGNQYRPAQTGKPDYANKSLEEQVALFSKLVMENSKRPIYRVWSKLDPVAHSVIMSELGCFDGKDAPQLIRARHHERARELAAELKRHTRRLRRFFEKQIDHEYRAIYRLGFRNPCFHFRSPEGRVTLKSVLQTELTHLEQLVAPTNRRLKRRDKWDARGTVRAQEYVLRRVAFLGIPRRVRLTPAAIADIYKLTQRSSDRGDGSGTAENIRKSIAYFRKNPENAHFLENIGWYLPNWTLPVATDKSGN